MAKKIRVWDGSAWQDVAPALPYTAVHSAQASMPSTAVDGQIWLDTDASVPSTTVTRWYKLPSAGTTTLSGNDDNSIPLAYTPGYEQVFLNGTLLSRSAADYTATTGTSVVLSSAIVAGDIVEIICPLQITTTDTYTQSATNAAFQANTNNFAAGKNKIINGDFNINQRAFSTSTSGSTYTFDRWLAIFDGGTTTWSAQTFTPGAAPVAGYEGSKFFRAVVSSQSGSSDYSQFGQYVEDVRNFAGQTITVSFWAKAGSGTPKVQVFARQVFGSGGSAQVDTAATSTTIGSSWNRYSATINVPSISGKTIGSGSYIGIWITLSLGSVYSLFNIGLQSNTFDFWGIQAEAGSNATAFQTSTGTLQGELAACQRYYWRTGSGDIYSSYGLGFCKNTTSATLLVNSPVSMRIPPTVVDGTGTASNYALYDGVTITPCTAISLDRPTQTFFSLNVSVASGLTQYRMVDLINNNISSAYLGFSAEL